VREKAVELAAQCGAKAYDSLGACLPGVDVVYILTPPSTHRALAIEAIEAGKHVVVEKPIAIELADAEAMIEAAERAGVKLMVAFNMRFRKGFGRLKEAVDSGSLGEPIHFWSQRLGIGVGPGPNWRTTPELLCGMSIESLSHDIDLVRWIAGEVVDVRANIYASRPDLPRFDDNANVVLTLANGGTATIHASWCSHLARNSRGVIGTQGTAMLEGSGLWNLDRFHVKTKRMEHETIEVLNDKLDVQSYREESRHFLDCVANDRQPTVTGRDGLVALRISHAILTSHRESRVVALKTE
jgi:myo-inositol 2-dehydrogenase/D-chiro-inositol 1-dehydrogenase